MTGYSPAYRRETAVRAVERYEQWQAADTHQPLDGFTTGQLVMCARWLIEVLTPGKGKDQS